MTTVVVDNDAHTDTANGSDCDNTHSSGCESTSTRSSFEKIEAILANKSHGLRPRLAKAVGVIEDTIRLYLPSKGGDPAEEGRVFVSFNGGKDATVVLHLVHFVLHTHGLLSLLGTAIKIMYFDDPHQFAAIDHFIKDSLQSLGVQQGEGGGAETFQCSFREGVEKAIEKDGLRAVLMGVREGDPHTEGAEHFHPSSVGYPAFMRVYPVLKWSYKDVWTFLRECDLPYCSLYDQGYTSIGNVKDTVPNPALLAPGAAQEGKARYMPAYLLQDEELERKCRRGDDE